MSERPWIEHDGMGCPVPAGTLIDVINHHGRVRFAFRALSEDGGRGMSWSWAARGFEPADPRDRYTHNLYWRLHADPQAEADRVNARQALFHGWIKEAETLPTCVPPEPVEPRETVR